ncbi:surface-adhesin E family protein [Nitrosospira sp. Is2]|uniref:surface-adhesin E family protein n=1 Tax=Nitrosospira sp. Is2 TaxID=3080532 RepID=UPI0029550B29|nr:surface-adhesin E family protein [Nitrosospira sp. Is2]WON73859.1 hypothetical protein R5L00_15465 [Nitrosospira sp. Is2]
MRTGILVLAMAIFSGSAWSAEWTLVKDNAKSGEKTYIDKSNVVRIGPLAQMSSLTNYQRPKGVAGRKHLSEKALVEFDCENREFRKLEFYWYSLHDGEGELIYSYKDLGTKLPVAPKSADEAAWKIACEKK